MDTAVSLTPANRMLRGALGMPPGLIERFAGTPPQVDGKTLDPAVHLMLAADRLGVSGRGDDIAKRRRDIRRSSNWVMPKAKAIGIDQRSIPGPDGPIEVRVYRSRNTVGSVPVIVYFHGGGWVVGDLDSHDGSCRMLAVHSGAVVVSVDYRLAPEHKFPAPLDDAVAAYEYVRDHVSEFGGAPGQVAVMGDSAGGNLAAGVCLVTRERGPMPVAQALVYPVTDLRITSPSSDTFAKGYFLTKEDMQWYRGLYLPPDVAADHPLASPLLAEDLSGLPPTAIWTAGFDPLLDDGRDYAERLLGHGVQVSYECLSDQIHGFFAMGVLPGGMRRIARIAEQTGDLIRGSGRS